MYKKLILVSPLMMAMACGVQNDMQEMKANTKEMNETTKTLVKKMDQMNNNMTGMSQTMNNMDKNTSDMAGGMKEMQGDMRTMKDEVKKTNENTGQMHGTMKKMAEGMGGMGHDMKHLVTNHEGLTKNIISMNEKMDKMKLLEELINLMKEMGFEIKKMPKLMEQLGVKMDSMGRSMEDMKAIMQDLKSAMRSMKEGLDSMESKLGDMNENMVKMSGALNNMLSLLENLSLDVKQAVAAALRTMLIESMEKTPDLRDKFVKAALYFMSYEFQLFRGQGPETLEKQKLNFKSAVSEFFMRVGQYITKAGDLSTAQSEPTEKQKNLFAIVAAMGELNPHQELINPNPVDQISMYTLLIEGLKSKARTPQELPPYAKVVQENKNLTLYLLQLRYNFIITLVGYQMVGVVSKDDPSSKSIWTYIKTYFKSATGSAETVDLAPSDIGSITQWRELLQKALQTKTDLKALGYAIQVNSDVQYLVDHLKISEPTSQDNQGKKSEIQELNRVLGLLKAAN